MARSLAYLSLLSPWAKTLAGEASLGLCSSSLRCGAQFNQQRALKQSHCPCLEAPSNFGVKLARPGFGPAAELPTSWPA
jgi:hypothetical protein